MLCRNPYSFFALSFVHPKTWMRETQSRWSFFLPILVEWHSVAHTQQQEGFFRCVASSYHGKCSSSRSSSGDSLEEDSHRTDRAATTAMPPPTYPIGCYSPTSTQQCRVELTQRLSSIQVCYSLGFLCQSFTRLERVRISLSLLFCHSLILETFFSWLPFPCQLSTCNEFISIVGSNWFHQSIPASPTHTTSFPNIKNTWPPPSSKKPRRSLDISEKKRQDISAAGLRQTLTHVTDNHHFSFKFWTNNFLTGYISHHDDHLLDYR